MDQNLMTIFSGILTLAGSIVTYFISQAAKKHSNVKNIDALAKLANQAVSWVQKNYTDNPEKLSESINYVTEEAKKLKIKTNPAQIEAQIEASLAQLKKNFTADPAKTIKDVAQATSEVAASVSITADNISANALELANLVEPIINGTEGFTEE
ncbi:phage holin [Lactococcus lactis]|uniref:phage holin n=1 Tax=Lactococcus lactis TaxID=1358 RepID=UPI000A1FEC4C|nr:phage holin [Lactococcus lactis]OSP86954.1 phage holin [Lactococcus lactis]